MKKVVLKLDLHDDRAKQKAMKTVSTLQGIDSIAMDMKEMKMTVIGLVDPVQIVSKLRKYWTTDIITVGPAKEPEKKEEPKKEEAKKDEPKKEEGGGGGEKKEEPKKDAAAAAAAAAAPGGGEKKEEPPKKEEVVKKAEGEVKKEDAPKPDPVLELVKAYRAYNPHMTSYYHVQSIEENPNACVVC